MDRLNLFHDYLARNGLKVTSQRTAVVKKFLESEGHCSTEDLYLTLRGKLERIGYATVHRTLKLLVDSGLAEELHFGDGCTRFEATRSNQHHDHMVCLQCGRVIEFAEPRIEELQKRVAEHHDFMMRAHRLELYGLCRDCRRNKRNCLYR